MNYWLIIRLPILFAIGVSDKSLGVWSGSWWTPTVTRKENERSRPSCSYILQVNFLIFIRVICIVIAKLKANLMCKTDIKCRYAHQAGLRGALSLPFQERERLWGSLFGTLCDALLHPGLVYNP